MAKLFGAACFASSTAARAISSRVEGTVEAGLADTTPKTLDMISLARGSEVKTKILPSPLSLLYSTPAFFR